MPEVYVSIGTNVDRRTNVLEALRLLVERFGQLEVSTIYETEAMGFRGPNFYNLVVGFTTERSLAEVDRCLAVIEDLRGRRRGGDGFEDRTLDLDILLYGDTVDHQPPNDIPRRDILNYAFVLCPLAEIAGDRVHPECGRSFAGLWADFDVSDQRLWPVDYQGPEAGQAGPHPSMPGGA